MGGYASFLPVNRFWSNLGEGYWERVNKSNTIQVVWPQTLKFFWQHNDTTRPPLGRISHVWFGDFGNVFVAFPPSQESGPRDPGMAQMTGLLESVVQKALHLSAIGMDVSALF